MTCKNIRIIFSIFLLLSLSSCIYPKSQIELIKKGIKPELAVVSAVPDVLHLLSIGGTVFDNYDGFHESPIQTNTYIQNEISNIIGKDNLVTIKHPGTNKIESLRSDLSLNNDNYYQPEVTDDDINNIASWGKIINVDYVLLITSFRSPLGPGNVTPTGKGIFTSLQSSSVFTSYKYYLVDTKTSDLTDYSIMVTYKYIGKIRKELSEYEISEIKKEWSDDKEKADLFEHVDTLEYRIRKHSYCNSNDFSRLSNNDIVKIENEITPLLNRNIKHNLINLGLSTGEKIDTHLDRVKNFGVLPNGDNWVFELTHTK